MTNNNSVAQHRGQDTASRDYDAAVVANVSDLLAMRALAYEFKLQPNTRARAFLDGNFRSAMRGRGMEFAEVRPYQPGDDIRNIDWRVTARSQATYTKLYQEEKERPVYVVVDQRSSMFFGSRCEFKSVYAAKLAALTAWCAANNGDRVGSLVFNEFEQKDLQAKRGKNPLLALINNLSSFSAALAKPTEHTSEKNQDLQQILTEVQRISKPGSALFIISDFEGFNEECKKPLSLIARHCNVNLFKIYDKLEHSLPQKQWLKVSDGESTLNLSTKNKVISESFKNSFELNEHNLKSFCMDNKIHFGSTAVDQPIREFAAKQFQNSHKRGAY